MSARLPTLAEQKRLVQQWGETGRLLHKIRYAELAAESAEESRQAAYDMLRLGGMLPPDPRYRTDSGLIEMQRHFAKLRERNRR